MLGVIVRMCLLCKGAEAGIQQGCRPAVKSEESLDRKGCWFLACILQWAVVWGMFGTTVNRNCCVLIRNNHFSRQRSGCRGCAYNLLPPSWPPPILLIAPIELHWGWTLWLLLEIAAQQVWRKEKNPTIPSGPAAHKSCLFPSTLSLV